MFNEHSADFSSPLAGSARSSHDEHEHQPILDTGGPPIHVGAIEQPRLPQNVSSLVPTPASLWASPTLEMDEELGSERRTIGTGSHFSRSHNNARESLLAGQESMNPNLLTSTSGHQSVVSTDQPKLSPKCPSVKSQAHSKKLTAHRYWVWEISASVLSIFCIASIVGVLVYEDGKPLNKWGLGQRYLSPNVVVSFLGTLGKSACLLAVTEIVSQLKWLHFQRKPHKLSDLQLFDNASRGPWGALQLLFRENIKAMLATCAAIITLASLLIDPFIQSVFHFPSNLTTVEGEYPTILSSQIFDPFSTVYTSQQCISGGLSTTLQAAILTPIWNATKQPSLPCGFERCEWPTITTLGVCSECVDLTDTLESTCRNNHDDIFEFLECNYTLPKSENTFNVVAGEARGATQRTAYSTLWNSASEDTSYKEMIVEGPSDELEITPNLSPIVSNFTFVQLDPFDVGIFTHSRDSKLRFPRPKKAMQCTMRLCARVFETPYYGNFSAGPLTGPQVDLVTSVQGSSPTIYMLGTDPIFLGLQPATKEETLPNTTFQINYCDYWSLVDYTSDLFTATMSGQGIIGSTLKAATDGKCPGTPFDPTHTPDRTTPNVGLALSQVDDIPALMQQIADSITEAMRNSVNSSSTNGVAMSSEVFIAINWAWLALPISVTILTFVLLLVVIITNHARNMPPWRSSSLALLFHEVDGWDSSEMIVSGPEDMAARAKGMKGQVTYEEDLLLFTKAE